MNSDSLVVLRCGRSDTKETWDVPAFHTVLHRGSRANGDMNMIKMQKASFEGMNVKALLDPTGCGNTFCGGFLAGWYQTRNLLTAALWGSVSASFSKPLTSYPLTACYRFFICTQLVYMLANIEVQDIS